MILTLNTKEFLTKNIPSVRLCAFRGKLSIFKNKQDA